VCSIGQNSRTQLPVFKQREGGIDEKIVRTVAA
jgi:hypothetical protein